MCAVKLLVCTVVRDFRVLGWGVIGQSDDGLLMLKPVVILHQITAKIDL
jgi:hypothetical protein